MSTTLYTYGEVGHDPPVHMVAGPWIGPREVKRSMAQNTSLCGKKLARFRGRPGDTDLICGTCRRLSNGGEEVQSVQAQIDAALNSFNPALEQDFKFEVIPLDQLVVDMSPDEHGGVLQRPQQPPKVARMLREGFSWALFNLNPPLVWATGDGRYLILDGQHEAAAAKIYADQEGLPAGLPVRCRVLRGITRQQAADYFHHQNVNRSAVKRIDNFMVDITRRDPDTLVVQQIVASAGRVIGSNGKAGNIAGVGTLLKIYKWPNGPEILRKTLAVNTAAWHGSAESSHNQVIEITALFVRAYHQQPSFDLDRLIHILRSEATIQPVQLIMIAKAEPKVWRKVAVAKLHERYNNRLGSNRRLPE